MIYVAAAVVLLSASNIIVSLLNLKLLREMSKLLEQREIHPQDEHDIHNILNHRLLDIQNRKYALQRRK